jgi:hypothetical protein
MSFDLTLGNYRSLCAAIKERQSDCRFIAYLNSKEKKGNIILRHDVDRKPKRALRMAKIESEMGIRSSYYFRSTKGSFRPDIMKEIEGMGHEVGYHYEVLVRANGDAEKAVVLFEEDLKSFREYVEIKTICSHGSPLSKIDSRDLWVEKSYSNYGIAGDASVSVTGVIYLSDTGGRWGSKANIRDNVGDSIDSILVNSTHELIELLKNDFNINAYISCHPERWSNNAIESTVQSIKDSTINAVKFIIMFGRKK